MLLFDNFNFKPLYFVKMSQKFWHLSAFPHLKKIFQPGHFYAKLILILYVQNLLSPIGIKLKVS